MGPETYGMSMEDLIQPAEVETPEVSTRQAQARA